MGNKTPILNILYALFPRQYNRYIEPFGGSGAVLLGKEQPDKFEVYNDYNRNLVNLFRCMRDRPMEFIRTLGFLNLNARDDFLVLRRFFDKEEFTDEFLQQELELTEIMLPPPEAREIRELYRASREDYDLRRAVMFLKLIRYSYSSGGKSFACQPFNIASLFTLITQLGVRMAETVIENQDFEVLIKHYDRPDSFFYLDPPYYTSEYVYDCGFTWEDHLRLHRALSEAQGQWLISYNDCPEIRELYGDFNQFGFSRIHSMVQKISRPPSPAPLIRLAHVQNKDSRSPRKINTQNTTTKASLWKSMMNLIQAITTPAIITSENQRCPHSERNR